MEYYVGQVANFSKTISETYIYTFAGISGDFNPVHINKLEAEKSIFGRQVAHGILGASFISTVIGMQLPGPGTIYMKQSLEFKAPIYIGDTVTAEVKIVDINGNKAIMETKVTNQDGKTAIIGEAMVRLP